MLKREGNWAEDSLGKINRALKGKLITQSRPRTTIKAPEVKCDINFLRAHEWHYGEERTSLAEITIILKARYKKEDPEYTATLRSRLPAVYREFKNIFSRKENNTLPPRRECDHQITLTQDLGALRGGNALYHIPLEKLDLLRETLHKHLNCGFIIPSKAAYTSPVLFTPKLNGG